MSIFHPANVPPCNVKLSRRAAARYAVVTAVKDRRSRRDALRDPRPLSSWRRKHGDLASSSSPRC